MLYLRHIPKAPLSNFVELFWYWDGFPSRQHSHERLMPDGAVAMVINLKEDQARIYDRNNLRAYSSFPGALVCGPHSDFFVIDTAGQASVMGIQFRPGGAFPFFKLPVDELHNLHVSLADLWGARASELRERVQAGRTPKAKVEVMERFLTAQALRGFDRHPAVGFALGEFQSPELPAIAAVTDKIG